MAEPERLVAIYVKRSEAEWLIEESDREFADIDDTDSAEIRRRARAALDAFDAECTTIDCNGRSVASVEIAGEWCRYCMECAAVLERSGDPTRWDKSAGVDDGSGPGASRGLS